MAFRASVIGIMAAGMVLLGNGAYAEPLPAEQAGGNAAPQVTVVNVYGDNNVIAADRSVMAVGDDSRLNANSGDVSSSGALGIDSKNSTFDSGASNEIPAPNARRAPSHRPVSSPVKDPGPTLPVSGDGQGTAISGYEDHSVKVAGEDQVAVYDDSNLFVNRNGQINANTGDTDSSGLNAVDVSGSTVKSGNHTEDGENGDDDEDDGEEEESTSPEAAPPAQQTTAPNGMRGGPDPQSTGTVTDEGETRATGKNTLTIGADGYDNLGTDVKGKRNIAAYDDSNVVMGGSGKTNAQIGDSDTSGAVVMGIKNSDVQSGNST